MWGQGWSCNRPAVSHRELGSCKNPAWFRFKGQIFLSGVGFSLDSWLPGGSVCPSFSSNSLRQPKTKCNEQNTETEIIQLSYISVK